jgi:hypothetical protein
MSSHTTTPPATIPETYLHAYAAATRWAQHLAAIVPDSARRLLGQEYAICQSEAKSPYNAPLAQAWHRGYADALRAYLELHRPS